MKRFLSAIVVLAFIINSLAILFLHRCFDCSSSQIKSICCEKKLKPNSIKSDCTCCGKDKENEQKYYTVNHKYEILLSFYLDYLASEYIKEEANITTKDIPPQYGGSLKIPLYKSVRHLLI